MGRDLHLTMLRRARRATALVAATALAGGCAVFGGGAAEEPRDPSPAAVDTVHEPVPVEADHAPARASDSLAARMRAGDYDGVLAAYAADSTLHTDEDATWHAAIASAMSGHEGYDPRRAATLFERLLSEHPDTPRRSQVELYLDMLGRERELRATVGRLDRELKQLKAIDLGQAPEDDEQ